MKNIKSIPQKSIFYKEISYFENCTMYRKTLVRDYSSGMKLICSQAKLREDMTVNALLHGLHQSIQLSVLTMTHRLSTILKSMQLCLNLWRPYLWILRPYMLLWTRLSNNWTNYLLHPPPSTQMAGAIPHPQMIGSTSSNALSVGEVGFKTSITARNVQPFGTMMRTETIVMTIGVGHYLHYSMARIVIMYH